MALVVSRGQVTAPRRLGLLPAEATSFVGRTTELAGISGLLATTRLVTVAGPAGVGKTRTSLRAASAAAGQFPDGTWLADLGEVAEPAALVGTVAGVLGLPGAGLPTILRYLRSRRLLLILDTCEHLVDACATFADSVLRAAPEVTLLATSRQPLDAQGEHAFPLPPLPAETDAADLFAQRAAAVAPGFAVTPRNQADVARICRRLDGIPLAIELAAVRLRALPLPELARQLDSGIRLLTVSRRGTSLRHQTLRSAVEWSYQLCTPPERALWERLSVFAGTFDVSAAEEVCADDTLPRDQVIHALVGLVDKSVVLRDDANRSRYRLLGALREFGADRLEAPGRCLDRLTARCLAMARDFDERFRPGPRRPGQGTGQDKARDQAAAVHGLRSEYDNIHAVLGYALGPDAPADGPARRRGAELATLLSRYWQVCGQLEEGRHWLGKVAGLFPAPSRERALALGERGRLATFQGDLAGAARDLGECVRLAEAAGHDAVAARGYLYLNLALTFAGRYPEAGAAAETARLRLTACGDQAGLIGLEAQLAHLHHLAGDAGAAIECCERGLALLGAPGPADRPAGGERWVSGYLFLLHGLALAQRPGPEQPCARALCRALIAKHELGDVVGTAYAIEALAWLAAASEQHERTAWLLGAADLLWDRAGRRLSGVARMEESRQQAVTAAREALGQRRFTAAHAHGGALSLDVVVREAVAGAGTGQRAGAPGASGGAGTGAVTAAVVLTNREREIADLVTSGLSNREIAERLFISKRTVDAHVEHIFSKLEISSRVQLTVLLRDGGATARPPGRLLRPAGSHGAGSHGAGSHGAGSHGAGSHGAGSHGADRDAAPGASRLPRGERGDQVGHAERGGRVQDLRARAGAGQGAGQGLPGGTPNGQQVGGRGGVQGREDA
jgi:predicted ATPase/DNA-binding CsgD family transcriptional regulator